MEQEIYMKYQRIYGFLERTGYEAVVIGRKDNFSWITFGGSNEVIWDTEYGFCILVITEEHKYCISYIMDGYRIMEEELQGQGYTYIPLKWYETSPTEKVKQMLKGKKIVSDIDLGIGTYDVTQIYDLHYPLLDTEVNRLRILGKEIDEVLYKLAQEIIPGMTEIEVKRKLTAYTAARDMGLSVALVGSDERVKAYRHPIPTHKKIENYVLITPSVYKWGLHANIARAIIFGKADEDLQRRYNDACYMGAVCMSMCQAGIKHTDILDVQKQLYEKLGYQNEWEKHFQGAIIGYMISNASRTLDEQAVISDKQAYEWFITITGVKSAELGINIGSQREILSTGHSWPTYSIEVNNQCFQFPILLER
ncbi:MAG: antitoxin VapB [Clostridia bacterium]|jgi:Xaa-Pro aminopeptidase|nr:antitoxin VapB [Clostridia bacterium]